MARVDPLPPDEWSEGMRAALMAIAPPAGRSPKTSGQRLPRALNNLGTFAHHPDLANAYFPFNAYLLHRATLSDRQRMLLILRVAALQRSEYLWAVQTHVGRDIGLSDEEISGVASGPQATHWNELEASLLQAADDLVSDGAISAPTWAGLSTELDTRQILDVIFTIGSYETLTFMLRSFDLELDDDLQEPR
jgi:alkylhydroperoxidase family enzyme